MDARLLSDGAAPDRYDGRPFLRLLECYVLWSAGQLSPHHAVLLEEMTPRLRDVYRRDGDWHEIVGAEMEFPPELPAALRSMWDRTTAVAGTDVDAEAWARQVVDTNFI